ncbi:MAG TPA: hypothetical protein DEQ02_05810 [Ruminococcaceae bacterium]|nr:hypothetical protein [Oscillospiraceae bacterium]
MDNNYKGNENQEYNPNPSENQDYNSPPAQNPNEADGAAPDTGQQDIPEEYYEPQAANAAAPDSGYQAELTRSKKRKFKHGAYAAVFVSLFIAGVIVINVIASVLAARFPLSLDLTQGKEFTVSQENGEFIRNISKDVTITVAAAEEDFSDGTFYSTFYSMGLTDPTGGKYFNQIEKLLKNYARLSRHIKLRFVDPQSPAFSRIAEKYSGEVLSYGSIIIASEYTAADGSQGGNHKILSIDALVEIGQGDGQYAVVNGSKLETSVTSAIAEVAVDMDQKIVLLTGYGEADTTAVKGLLAANNYFVEEMGLLSGDIPADADAVMLFAPTKDFAPEEITKLDNYLKNGETGKNLIFFASSSQSGLTNLYEYLEEWGFGFQDGVVMETNLDMTYEQQNTTIIGNSAGSLYTSAQDAQNRLYVAGGNKPIALSESSGGYETETLVQFGETCVISPDGVSAPGASTGSAGPLAMVSLSRYTADGKTSGVLMFSSDDMMNDMWSQFEVVGNRDLAMSLTGSLSGRSAAQNLTFDTKTITVPSYADKTSGSLSNIMAIVFIAVIPLIIISIGIIIWARRLRL